MLGSFTTEEARLASIISSVLALVILLCRVAICLWRRERRGLGLYLVIASITIVTARVVVVYYLLADGTANDTAHKSNTTLSYDDASLATIKRGSILSLVSRVLITSIYWLQSCILLYFYKRMIQHIPWVSKMIIATWIVSVTTFIAVNMVTFLECRPLSLYWQVIPQTASCAKANVQLFLQGLSNLVLDVMLLIISLPILCHRGYTWKQQLRIWSLCLLGTVCAVVTSLRMAYLYDRNPLQTTRSVWASVQVIVSTFVANAPVIYADIQLLRRNTAKSRARLASQANIEENMPIPLGSVALCQSAETTKSLTSHSSRKEWFDHIEE